MRMKQQWILLTRVAWKEVMETIMTYEHATWANINIHKSKALPIETWDNAEKTVHIQHKTEARIQIPRYEISHHKHYLDHHSEKLPNFWRVKENYLKDQCVRQAIPFVHILLSSTLCYLTQVLPVTLGHTSNRYCIVWYVRNGEVFRAPISTLQRVASRGGDDLVDVHFHCMTEICALLGIYAAYICNQLPKFWENLLALVPHPVLFVTYL
jgi:hypothetical protein